MAVAIVPQPIRLPLPGASSGATVRVRPLPCGEVLWPRARSTVHADRFRGCAGWVR